MTDTARNIPPCLSCPDLMERLIAAQNRLACNGGQIDIVSFAGFCDDRAELEAHVLRYEAA